MYILAMSKLRICHLADVHLGYRRYNRLTKNGFNQREVDINVTFREAVDRVLALKPHLTIIAGDLFHTVRPSNAVITSAFRELKRLATHPVVLIGGNHETPRRVDTGSVLQLFTEIKNIYVADLVPESFTFKELNLSVLCLPHACLQQPETLKVRADDRYRFNVLALHAQLENEWMSDFGGIELKLEKLSPHEWDYIALGHIHARRVIGLNAAYSGSLEHTASNIWAEARENKGFIEIELPTKKMTFHALTSPREVLVLKPIIAKSMDAKELLSTIEARLEEVPGGIEGKIVRLEIEQVAREVYRALDHKALRRWRARALNFTIDLRYLEPTLKESALIKSSRLGLVGELDAFCKKMEGFSNSADELSQTVAAYIQKLEAIDEAR